MVSAMLTGVLFLAACSRGGPAAEDPVPPSCGNGAVDSGEACDGVWAGCTDLGASWGDGDAACEADCDGWDVSACSLAEPTLAEMVKPALRASNRYPDARCNDGTPSGFEVRLSENDSPLWVIWLGPGALCEDNAFPCRDRPPELITTPNRRDATLNALGMSGLFGANPALNPVFLDANFVFAHYCSSDLWTGHTTERRPTTGDPESGWYFSGHAQVDAMMGMLVERYGLDDEDPDLRVLFGGSSAGAQGVSSNIENVIAVLPNVLADGRLRVLVDAGWITDWDVPGHRMGLAVEPDRDVFAHARLFWGAHADPLCEATADEPGECYFGPSWYPWLATERDVRVLVQESLNDSTMNDLHHIDVADAEARALWQAEVEASLSEVDRLFASEASYHTLALTDDGFSFGTTGDTFGDVVRRFASGGEAERVFFVGE